MTKRFPWNELREWMRKHGITNRQLTIRHWKWYGRVPHHRAVGFFKRVRALYPEDTVEGKEFSVIIGMYYRGSRWAYVDEVAFEPPAHNDPEAKAKLVRPIQ